MMKYGLIGVIALALLGGALYVFPISNTVQQLVSRTRCLKGAEKATYEVLEEGRPGKVRVSVIDTIASTTLWEKEVVHPTPNTAYPVRLGKCAWYVPQSFNYDFERGEMKENYSFEIWKYEYFKDSGNRLVITSENKTGEKDGRVRYYSGSEFTVDPSEKYIVLTRSYLGEPDYALVVKNISTGKDVVTLTLADVLKKYPQAAGSFDVGSWHETPDGTYLFGDIYDGSRWVALWGIKRDTWEVDIRPTPEDYLPGVERSAPFGNNEHLAYTDVIVWAGGVREIEDELLNEAIAEGRKKNLFVTNLRTRQKVTAATVPILKGHRFNPTWLSDTELEYTMPDGTRKTYQVEE